MSPFCEPLFKVESGDRERLHKLKKVEKILIDNI